MNHCILDLICRARANSSASASANTIKGIPYTFFSEVRSCMRCRSPDLPYGQHALSQAKSHSTFVRGKEILSSGTDQLPKVRAMPILNSLTIFFSLPRLIESFHTHTHTQAQVDDQESAFQSRAFVVCFLHRRFVLFRLTDAIPRLLADQVPRRVLGAERGSSVSVANPSWRHARYWCVLRLCCCF